MGNRKPPSHPSSITPERIAAALANIGPSKPRETLKATKPLPKVERTTTRKVGYVQQRLSAPRPKYKRVGEETTERAIRAKEGVEAERLSNNDGHQRAKIRRPMMLVEERIYRAAEELNGGRPPAKTLFDLFLDHSPNLLWCLDKYITDLIATKRTSSDHDGVKVDQNNHGSSPLPFNRIVQNAIRHCQLVKSKLAPEDYRDLQVLARAMVEGIDFQEPESMEEFGLRRSGGKDRRFNIGFFSGVLDKVGEKLFSIYITHTVAPELRRAGVH